LVILGFILPGVGYSILRHQDSFIRFVKAQNRYLILSGCTHYWGHGTSLIITQSLNYIWKLISKV